MGLVEQMACLLSSGYANGRQIKGLFNYILQTGDAVRFNDFIDGVAKRSPKHKVSLMTIAERLRQEGEQSKALHIAKIMLELSPSCRHHALYRGVRRRVGCGEPVKFCPAISKATYTLCFNATSR